MAMELQQRYDKEDQGKGKAPEEQEEDEDDGIELVKEEIPDLLLVKTEVVGINGSSSSTTKAVHPMFGGPSTPARKQNGGVGHSDVKAEAMATPDSATKLHGHKEITSTSAEPVEPIDFDVDQFLFRPADIDISRWPKGRLPYSVLVGVYVQVSSTRSRLLIVRVLTK